MQHRSFHGLRPRVSRRLCGIGLFSKQRARIHLLEFKQYSKDILTVLFRNGTTRVETGVPIRNTQKRDA
jgi:hypothetical protein